MLFSLLNGICQLFGTLPLSYELHLMNYLAHAYLSFEQPEILAGNMISDFIKGKQKFIYSEAIQKGITLHRLIDHFTDTHEATRVAKQYFKPAVGLYAGAFVDIVYDHFLALDKTQHTLQQLKDFAGRTYSMLEAFTDVMPERFTRMFPYMKAQDWLYNYHTVIGIENSFGGLVRRAAYLDSSVTAFDAFKQHYNELQQCYESFFPHVKIYAEEQLRLLNASKQ